MSMDALALLNALDVIRNESVYQKRLNDLAEAQAKLDTSEYIVETVEIANIRLEEANRLLEKHREMIENAEREIAKLRIEKLADLVKSQEELDNKIARMVQSEKDLKSQQKSLEYEQNQLDKLRQQLQYSVADYDARRVEHQTASADYHARIEKLRNILG